MIRRTAVGLSPCDRDQPTYAKATRFSRDAFVTFLARLQAGLAWCAAALLVSTPGAGAAEPLRIIAFGDSLTAGYQLPADAAFPAVLERRLRQDGYEAKIVNAGVSGDTSGGGLARIGYTLRDGADLVILELGVNDHLRGLDPKGTRANLEKILAACDAKGIEVLLAGMIGGANFGLEHKQEFDDIFPNLAKERGLPLYPFFLDGVLGAPGMTLPDGLHPSRAGVERIVAGIAPLVERTLDQIRAERSGGAAAR